MPRLFIAIDLPKNIKDDLALMAFGIPGARWMTPDQMHLTLTFIGDVNGSEHLDIEEALEKISVPNFAVEIRGVGHFPPRGNPRVIWAGVGLHETLARLKKKIDLSLHHLGLEIENRKFMPHITLARLKNTPYPRVGDFIAQHNLLHYSAFAADHFCLYSSTLNSSGSKHERLIAYPLTHSQEGTHT